MSKGAHSQAGFNAQNWAALSLFVQYSSYPSFRSIELEQPKLADFVLVFDKKRIICESKKSHISYANLRSILDTIPDVGADDEILIICTSVGPRIKEDLENAKYFPEIKTRLTKQHQFTTRHLELLAKVNIWVVDQDMNEDIVRSLLGERFQSWLPDDELEDLMASLLIKNVYNKSAKGQVYTKAEFNDELTKRRELLKTKDDYKHSERSAKDHINTLLSELNNVDSRLQSEHRLKAVIADSRLHYFALREISKVQNLNLAQWDNLWHATFGSYYAREVLRIFADNVKDELSAEYVVDFLKKSTPKLRFRNMEEYEFKAVADILMKAIDVSDALIGDAFELLKELYEYSTENPLYVDRGNRGRDKWLLGELAKDFHNLYIKADLPVKERIVNYVYNNFDIVDEESEYWHKTPFDFLEILKQDLLAKPEKFEALLSHLQEQYQKNYSKYKVKYDGWELMGGSVSNFAGEYTVHDKAFVDKIIRPFLNSLSIDEQWKIVDQYVALRVSDVSADKPDFINRAFVPFLVDQYTQDSDKAFKILSRFIKMRKGIPNKTELIFFYVRDLTKISAEKQWSLLEVAINEFGYPVNVFMDQVLWGLLARGHTKALKTFSELVDDEKYMGRQVLFDSTVIDSIEKILGNEATFELGTELLERYLQSEFFKNLDSFDSYDAKKPILSVLNKDFEKGASLVNGLTASPSENQQRVFGAVLRDTPDELLDDVFNEIVKPEIQAAMTPLEMAKKYTNVETRENFIWFAEKLSKKHKFDETFYIVDFFLTDPNPMPGNDYDEEVFAGKQNLSINTVRGCIAWALLPVNSVAGRSYVGRAFKIVKTLCTDKSPYVRQMSVLMLEALANNRHTTMPDSKEWFMDYAIAKEIEDFSFQMLHDKANYQNAIMKHLARVFARIRTLNDEDALDVINIFEKYSDAETLKELNSFIIFMAEFRKDSFEDWPKSRGIIKPHNPEPIQNLLKDLLEKGRVEQRQSLAWHLAKLPEEPIKNKGNFDRFFGISMKYLPFAIKKYDNHLFSSIHNFIKSYIDDKFDDCYRLWKMSLKVEREALIKESKKGLHPGEYNWWPYHHNGSILVKVLEKKGVEQFLQDIDYLADYPEEVTIAYDFEGALAELEKIKTNKDDIARIYEKLISRNYLYNDSYDKWLASN